MTVLSPEQLDSLRSSGNTCEHTLSLPLTLSFMLAHPERLGPNPRGSDLIGLGWVLGLGIFKNSASVRTHWASLLSFCLPIFPWAHPLYPSHFSVTNNISSSDLGTYRFLLFQFMELRRCCFVT